MSEEIRLNTDEMMVIEARSKAGNYFKEGNNCAEAIFLTFREYLMPEMDPKMVKLVTGFGSGIGEAGCMCGALTGSIIALNMVKGRSSKEEDRTCAYDHAREFHDRFIENFGTTCCRALNTNPFESREHLTTCLKITGNTGKLLMEYLLEKELLK